VARRERWKKLCARVELDTPARGRSTSPLGAGNVRMTLVLASVVYLALAIPVSSDEKQMVWPPLPSTGFIKGRAATTADVASGNAAFVLDSGGKSIGRPLNIDIPQYGLLRDDKTDTDTPVIVTQAETNGTLEVAAYIRVADKKVGIATLKEIRLLGTDIHHLPAPNNRWRGP
jgi:hypothetical protein